MNILPLPGYQKQRRKPLRWELEGGSSGNIQTLVREPGGDVIVVAGYSFRGQMGGDLVWFDLATGEIIAQEHVDDGRGGGGTAVGQPASIMFDYRTQEKRLYPPSNGHRSLVTQLAVGANSDWIVSTDLYGRVVARSRSAKSMFVLQDGDANRRVDKMPIRVVAMLGDSIAAVPRYLDGAYSFQIDLFDLEKSKTQSQAVKLPSSLNPGDGKGAMITSLAGSADGKWLVAGDHLNRLHVWRIYNGESRSIISSIPNMIALTLAIHPDKPTLAVGVQTKKENGTGFSGEVQLFNLNQLKTSDKMTSHSRGAVTKPINRCAFSPDGKRIAFSTLDDPRVYIAEEKPGELAYQPITKPRILTDAFLEIKDDSFDLLYATPPSPIGADSLNSHRSDSTSGTAIASRGDIPSVVSPTGPWNRFTFDPFIAEKLQSPPSIPKSDLPGWSVSQAISGKPFQLTGPNGQLFQINYDKATYGRVDKFTVFQLSAINVAALEMEHTHEIHCYELRKSPDTCPLLRILSGHNGSVKSIRSVPSQQPRYLISTGNDGVARIWPLAELVNNRFTLATWGVVAKNVDGKLQFVEVADTSPLFFQGIRPGDLLREIKWNQAGPGENAIVRTETGYDNIQRQLLSLSPSKIVTFCTERAGKPLREFQMFGGWSPLLNFFSLDDEWIAWHPTGYYACSAGGESLIGWHQNNDLFQPPTFYDAAMFNREYHRPDLIKKLLIAGQITKLLMPNQVKIAPEIIPPRIDIVELVVAEPKGTPLTTVSAKAKIINPSNLPILEGQAYVDGVPRGVPLKWTDQRSPLEFRIELSPGKYEISFEARTESSRGMSGGKKIEIPGQINKPRMWILAIGVGKYADKDLVLDDPAPDAITIGNVFEEMYPQGEYRAPIASVTLTDSVATRDEIKRRLQQMVSNMQIGDRGVVYLSGHGRITADNDLRFAPIDANFDRPLETCLSFSELKPIFQKSQNPLLVILNAYHTAADSQKTIERYNLLGVELNQLGPIMLLASTPGTKASRLKDFSTPLLVGLKGAADEGRKDGKGDGLIFTSELPNYLYEIGDLRFVNSRPGREFPDFILTVTEK